MLSDQEQDYRFGWRWLLPIKTGDLVLLLGFNEHDLAFLKQAMVGVELTEIPAEATVLVVNDLLPDADVAVAWPEVQSLCVVGSGKNVSAWCRWAANRFTNACHYSMLPSDKPRIVLPLGKSEWIIRGLTLHRPGRWLARCAVFALQFLAQFSIDYPLRNKMVFIANKDHNFQPQGARQGSLHPRSTRNTSVTQSFVLYLGTPGECRKTVVLPLDANRPTILKYGELPKAKTAIRNEAKALEMMSQTSLASKIPLLYDLVERDGCVTLHQEYRLRKNMPVADLERFSSNFLAELSEQGRSTRPIKDLLDGTAFIAGLDISETVPCAHSIVRDELDSLAEKGVELWGHRSHGDFAPWNYAWTERGFFVFDWEESQPWEIAFSDVFYLIIGPAIHVARSPKPRAVESQALELAIQIAKRAAIPIDDIRIYWGLWLLQRIRKGTAPLYEKLLEHLSHSWK